MKTTFRSLANYNYRLWAAGAFISNIGTWMQRTAQDWIVLTELTQHDATAVGIVMSLQFGPQFLLLPLTGAVADRYDRRRVLFFTQSAMGLLALGLGVLTLTGAVELWHVYLFALLLGCTTAFDSPTRQSFVSELVGDAHLSNAVALNSTSFNAGRLVGPAVAGVLIAWVGSGWVFVLNALSFAGVLAALVYLRPAEFHPRASTGVQSSGLMDGLRHVWARGELRTVLFMFFLIGTFGLNFPIYISTMAVSVFAVGAREFGLLTSSMAVGSVTGALLSAGRDKPRMGLLVGAAVAFGVALLTAAAMPTYRWFAVALFFAGLSTQTFTTTAHSAAQLWSDPFLRGRVIALVLAVSAGGTPLGAPLIGLVANRLGARWALVAGAMSGLVAAAVGAVVLVRRRRTANLP
ncbi:MFS transporter [Ramlibacter albus]|uniref:MFS transporter n=1 Tax=Ramlibacter albus TaxID=2079448 RepID=A0A923S562_9BURK|nr:MFS transporter [Ramlibacter albus]